MRAARDDDALPLAKRQQLAERAKRIRNSQKRCLMEVGLRNFGGIDRAL